jgi:two-component system, OmpR family, sensor kinase
MTGAVPGTPTRSTPRRNTRSRSTGARGSLPRRSLPWILGPLLAGAAAAGTLQATTPGTRLYLLVSPALLAAVAGLLGAWAVAAVAWVRTRTAAVTQAALRHAAAQASEDRLRFLLRLDHELKNPLTAIRAGLANIQSAEAAAGAADALASVSAQTDRIARLVGDLRKLAELETQPIEAAPVDLPGLLHEVAEAVGEIPAARERNILVTVPQAPWPLPLLEGDRDLLFIALQNLVANAVKFTGPGDTVEVRASEDGEALLVEVADTGTGIPPDEIGQVWQELARGRAARSLPGTGIGLALVRVIVARHQGQAAIRSRDGQGTVVSVRIPVAGRAETAPVVAGLRQRRDTPGNAAV